MAEFDINVAGIVAESITDGPGIRFVLFVQGCPHNCEGCQNQDAIPFKNGVLTSAEEVFLKIKQNPLLGGVTFSGGEPFCQPGPLLKLAQRIKQINLEIAIYSGYTFEELLQLADENKNIDGLLNICDTLVDGRFILKEKTMDLRFRGSKNQRILDLKKSMAERKPVLDLSQRWNNI